MMENYDVLKSKLMANVENGLGELIALSDEIADHPELSGQEYETSKKIVALLRQHGFEVEYPFAGLETSFRGIFGPNNHKHKVAILTEYDALPGIGHACGHCVSGSISILAALALVPLQDELNCDIHILGTPNEEIDGAKCAMVDQGVFSGYDMAMMIHLYDQNLLYCKLLGLHQFLYTFHGKAAHASAAPWDGINALNGAQLMFHGIDMLRQHVTPDVRMHGVYRNGGEAPNIVPEEASAEFYFRALDKAYLFELDKRADRCAEGAAIMTDSTWEKALTAAMYDNLKNNEAGLEALKEVYDELEIPINGDHDMIFGSSDAGNVSFVCPMFHPTLQIVDRGVAIHTREFAEAVKSDRAHQAIDLGAKVIGLQTLKIFCDEKRIAALRADFEK
ncbi:MAG: M20 family metallopeptidase [Firmicutes bacterium]|nr:M20 family metallopeptidase [Bacillota bacterium]